MNDREDIIKLWIDVWIKKKDLGISNIFDEKLFISRVEALVIEISAYDGISFVKFNLINKIIYLKEFGCNIKNYDPYKKGDIPEFIYENVLWN